jgi:hypothetical protein
MNSEIDAAHTRFQEMIGELTELVVDAADDRDGEFLGFPSAFAHACDLIYTKAGEKGTKIAVTLQEWREASPEEITSQFNVIEGCIAEQKILIK